MLNVTQHLKNNIVLFSNDALFWIALLDIKWMAFTCCVLNDLNYSVLLKLYCYPDFTQWSSDKDSILLSMISSIHDLAVTQSNLLPACFSQHQLNRNSLKILHIHGCRFRAELRLQNGMLDIALCSLSRNETWNLKLHRDTCVIATIPTQSLAPCSERTIKL